MTTCYYRKCSFLMFGLLLVLQESDAKLKTTGEVNPFKTKRFKDVMTEAKKAAIDEYLDNVLGGQKKSNRVDVNRKRDFFNYLRDDIELQIHTRKLQTLFRKRCVDWWCFGDKATSTTPTAPTTTTPPETTTPTTTPTTTTQSTSNTNWNYWLYLLRLLHRNRWWFG